MQPLPGASQVPVGGVRRQRTQRREALPRLRALHGGRLQNDHHRRRVSRSPLSYRCSLQPTRAKYPWVGCLEDNQEDKTPHANSLFMAADNTMITIGGGYVPLHRMLCVCGSRNEPVLSMCLSQATLTGRLIELVRFAGTAKRYGWTRT